MFFVKADSSPHPVIKVPLFSPLSCCCCCSCVSKQAPLQQQHSTVCTRKNEQLFLRDISHFPEIPKRKCTLSSVYSKLFSYAAIKIDILYCTKTSRYSIKKHILNFKTINSWFNKPIIDFATINLKFGLTR